MFACFAMRALLRWTSLNPARQHQAWRRLLCLAMPDGATRDSVQLCYASPTSQCRASLDLLRYIRLVSVLLYYSEPRLLHCILLDLTHLARPV